MTRSFHLGSWTALLLTVGLWVPSSSPGQKPDVSTLAGTWTWSWKDPEGKTHKHVLEVEGVDRALAAREIFDEEQPVKATGLTFDGKTVKFTVVRGERRADYTGKLDGKDKINGTVTTTTTASGQTNEFVWKAERRKAPKT
jgi:hypothetical protein